MTESQQDCWWEKTHAMDSGTCHSLSLFMFDVENHQLLLFSQWVLTASIVKSCQTHTKGPIYIRYHSIKSRLSVITLGLRPMNEWCSSVAISPKGFWYKQNEIPRLHQNHQSPFSKKVRANCCPRSSSRFTKTRKGLFLRVNAESGNNEMEYMLLGFTACHIKKSLNDDSYQTTYIHWWLHI